ATCPESQTAPGVGPHTSCVSMPPKALPTEIWLQIIDFLDDRCFVWFVLRRVSPYFRLVTEDVFARFFLRTCSLRFVGEHAKKLLPPDLQEHGDLYYERASNFRQAMRHQPPTFRFQPVAFAPADTKTKAVLRLCDPASDPGYAPEFQHANQIPSGDRLANVFFDNERKASSNRARLMNAAHFVRLDNQLKIMRIPSLVIDVSAREIVLDWRRLCQDFLYDELKCRTESNSLGSW
ncbi:hypothetical protein EK21DRAFT_40201, partial [Setomelanomma holmii]